MGRGENGMACDTSSPEVHLDVTEEPESNDPAANSSPEQTEPLGHPPHPNAGRSEAKAEGSGQKEESHRDGHSINKTVFLRAEAILEKQMKAISVVQFLGQSLAVALLIVEFVLKFTWADEAFLRSKSAQWWNLASSVVCLLAMVACVCILLKRIVTYRKKIWGRRRRVLVSYVLAEAAMVIISLVCMVIPNVYVLAIDCTWFSNLVRICAFIYWSAWNTLFLLFVIEARNINFWKRNGKVLSKHGRDRIKLDAPWTIHLWLFINWIIFEGVNIALLVLNTKSYPDRFNRNSDPCLAFDYNCSQRPVTTGLTATIFASWFVWILLWMYNIFTALQGLHQRPWHEYKMANTNVRVQIASRLYSVLLFGLCIILLYFVEIDSCASYVETWLGLGPMAIIASTTSIANMFFYMPKTPELKQPMIQAILQEFAWSEEGKAAHQKRRAERLKALGEHATEYPIFCFETAIKCFYFSALIYEYQEAKAAAAARRGETKTSVEGYNIERAMELYNLERFELLVEPAEDTKVLLCWNKDTAVLSFRGTASMVNVMADLQVWMTAHPPVRGTRFVSRPKIHTGFFKAWTTNGLNLRVMNRLRAIFKTPGIDMQSLRIAVTGHSLGGCLASLAAIDIAQEFSETLRREQVVCYTYGAPRTGNHAFARDCNRLVPDTWNVSNFRDIVPRSGKFVHKYKAHGHRVIMNELGDMIVRPSFVEFAASQSLPFQGRVQEHYLASYQASFIAICSAQYGDKAFKGGMEGLHELITSGEVHDVLSHGNLSEKKILATWGGVAFLQIQNQLQKGVGALQAGARGAMGLGGVSKPSMGNIRCHDGVCWREGLEPDSPMDRALSSGSRSSLTHSSRNLAARVSRASLRSGRGSDRPQATPGSSATSLRTHSARSGEGDGSQAARRAKGGAALDALGSGDDRRESRRGLYSIDGDESRRGQGGSCPETSEGVQEERGESDTEDRPASSHIHEQQESHSHEPGRANSRETDPRAAEARGGGGALEASSDLDGGDQRNSGEDRDRDDGGLHLRLPHFHLPRFLHPSKRKTDSTEDLGGEKDVLYGGGTDSRDRGELQASRTGGRYARHASRSVHESGQEDSSKASTSNEVGLAPPAEMSLAGPPLAPGGDGESRSPKTRLAGASRGSMSAFSESSFGSLKSHTLEENLTRMEKAGTLSRVIQSQDAKQSHSRSAERKGSGVSRLLSHLQSEPVRRTASHGTDAPTSLADLARQGASLAQARAIHHSTTM